MQLLTSISELENALNNIPSLEEVFSMDEIYECLQEFYYDERVSVFLSKVENSQLNYFLSKMYFSPDAKHLCIMIDLLGTKQEYVCLYKNISSREDIESGFNAVNALFNVKPEMAIRDDGIGYFVQRSE